MSYFCGIDPGNQGGIGVVDAAGSFIVAHRWNVRQPVKLFELLQAIRSEIVNFVVYLEISQTFPQKGTGFQNQNQSLLINHGIWRGFLLAAGIDFEVISPLTWQADPVYGLTSWAKKQSEGIRCHSPLTLARQLWPAAPLACQADDGKAVGLLLADLARRDFITGVDRRAMRIGRETKAKAVKRKKRDMKKLAAAAPQLASPAPAAGSFWPEWLPARPVGQVSPGPAGVRPQVRPQPPARKR